MSVCASLLISFIQWLTLQSLFHTALPKVSVLLGISHARLCPQGAYLSPYWAVVKFNVPLDILYGRLLPVGDSRHCQSVVCYWPYEPRRKKPCLRWFAKNKGADQPAHMRSLISAFVKYATSEIFDRLARLLSKAGWFEYHFIGNPEDRFSRVETHIIRAIGPTRGMFWASSG